MLERHIPLLSWLKDVLATPILRRTSDSELPVAWLRVTCPGPYIRQFAGYPRIGGAAQDVRVTPGFGPWKQTFSRSIMAWTQHGDMPRTEDVGGSSWKRLCSSQGHTRYDDEVSPKTAGGVVNLTHSSTLKELPASNLAGHMGLTGRNVQVRFFELLRQSCW